MSDAGSPSIRSGLLRERVYEEHLPFESSLPAVSLENLRRTFSTLFDRAAQSVEAAGFALDDSIVTRFIHCRCADGREWPAEAESLTDRGRFVAAALKAARDAGIPVDSERDVEIVSVQVEAIVERWRPGANEASTAVSPGVFRRRIAAIVNPISGRGSALARVRGVGEQLESLGASLTVLTTERRGHGTELARRAAREADALLAVGGDGTVCEVVNGLARSGVPMTILGMGTENLVAREFCMPTDAASVARLLTSGPTHTCDIGLANDRCFLAVAGIGFDAECVWRLTRVRRGPITHSDYVWPIFRAFFGHRFPRLAIDADGERVFEGKGLAIVGLIPRYSIGLRICARAKPDDGLLDLCVLPCSTRRELMAHAYRVIRGRHLDHHATVYRQVRGLHIASADRTFVQIDGDCADGPPIDCSICPAAIRLLAAPPLSSTVGHAAR